jgi:hypothetical protein
VDDDLAATTAGSHSVGIGIHAPGDETFPAVHALHRHISLPIGERQPGTGSTTAVCSDAGRLRLS